MNEPLKIIPTTNAETVAFAREDFERTNKLALFDHLYREAVHYGLPHDAHVQAWLDAEACEICGDVKPLHRHTVGSLHPQCLDCYAPSDEREDCRSFGQVYSDLVRGPL